MDHKVLFSKFLEAIKPAVSGANFKAFVSKSKIDSIDGDTVVLAAPTAFAKATLTEKHLPLIKRVFNELLQKNTEIQIIVKSSFQEEVPLEEDFFAPAIEVRRNGSVLNHKFTLENFVVGPTNNVAFAAAQAVAADPGNAYNPLFLYGGTGVGKTHLMIAIGNSILKKHPHFKIIYCSSDKFMNDYVAAIQGHSMGQFRSKYRSADVFLIDDIQFFSGREGTQEEFFHTFNELQSKNSQMVFTSDRTPQEIAKLEDRLKSRFVGGLMMDMQPPDFDTRVAILKAKCTERGEIIPEDTLKLLASSLDSNIRELEGKLIQILQVIKLKNIIPTVENIAPLIGQATKKIAALNSKQVISSICNYFNIDSKALTGPRRQKELVLPRHITMYLLSEELKMTVEKIGQTLGGRDHTTVMHGRDRIKNLIPIDKDLQRIIVELKNDLSTI